MSEFNYEAALAHAKEIADRLQERLAETSAAPRYQEPTHVGDGLEVRFPGQSMRDPYKPDDRDFSEPYAQVLIDFSEIHQMILDNIAHFTEAHGDERNYACELLASLLGDYMLINEQSDWPQESAQYYRSLVRPEDAPIVARLMEGVERIIHEYMPEFMSMENQLEREKIQYANLKNKGSAVWQFYLPDSAFRRLCSKNL